MSESFSSFSKRVNAGLSLVSDEEKEFEKESKEIQAILDQRNARREKLLWKSIPLLVRNWKLFRKYPRLYNIPIDFVYFGDFFGSISWRPQDHNLPLGGLVAAWKTDGCRLPCPEFHDEAYLVPQHEYDRHASCGVDDFWGGPSDFGDDFLWNATNYSNPYHVYCEKCGKIVYRSDFDAKIGEKQSLFERIMCQWNKYVHSEVLALQFEHALHLLTLCETCGEESAEFR